MSFYKVLLEKQQTYWWDEDKYGSTVFSAKSDEHARQVVATICQRMNRQYWRMNEQRNVSVVRLELLHEELPVSTEVGIQMMSPLGKYSEIRKALKKFYPRKGKGVHDTCMPCFTSWKKILHPQLHTGKKVA